MTGITDERLDELIAERYDVAGIERRSITAALRELRDYRKAVREHNDACQDLCGRGDQEAVRCKYRPYFVANGRRCPECPTDWIIEIPALAPAQTEKEGT